MKQCFKCGLEKPLTEFYRHPQMGDGHLNKCKGCAKRDVTRHRYQNIERLREYDRNRANLPHRIKQRKQVALRWKKNPKLRQRTIDMKRQWIERNAIKRAAHLITWTAIKRGDLVKRPCEVCGARRVDAHHDDYTKPLVVRWLCRKHHAEYHKKERECRRMEKLAA